MSTDDDRLRAGRLRTWLVRLAAVLAATVGIASALQGAFGLTLLVVLLGTTWPMARWVARHEAETGNRAPPANDGLP